MIIEYCQKKACLLMKEFSWYKNLFHKLFLHIVKRISPFIFRRAYCWSSIRKKIRPAGLICTGNTIFLKIINFKQREGDVVASCHKNTCPHLSRISSNSRLFLGMLKSCSKTNNHIFPFQCITIVTVTWL